jgi:cell division protein FtsZ
VVATGLQREPVRLAVENIRPRSAAIPATAADWRNLDKPTGMRQTERPTGSSVPTHGGNHTPNYADLDIPAFLRRQAD